MGKSQNDQTKAEPCACHADTTTKGKDKERQCYLFMSNCV